MNGEADNPEELSHLLSSLSTNHPETFDATASNHLDELLSSSASVRFLKGIAARDCQREGLKEVTSEADEILEADYIYEAKRLSSILDTLRVSRQHLSKGGEANLDALTNLAMILGLGETNAVSFQCAMTDLLIEEQEAEENHVRQAKLLESLERRMHDVDEYSGRVASIFSELQEGEEVDNQRLLEYNRNTDVLRQKGHEYNNRLAELEALIPPDIDLYRHDTILALQSEVDAMANELEKKDITLRSFCDLPPDMALARLKLTERRQELARLIENKQAVLSSIAHGIS
ncbi:uncharacterized protein SPPG_05459 [Spizellomyces punctatus DAOM BR117]|uniref:Uncharacterized protein n=1 Tax=Spizellomyces punctatus (strain DAOM BR117) TaxID=645134 RepID=A0A0L0HE03_SPIPD|nr:uncharacterized protein SPPG_05459 [Spizellomyces punctatus DAOM BR117]KNC99204.1 hypothetical protein SPPG_05459 [Spizellomyces punctatus DAOM BR117]|eukprot:XP_016607244.1 hypothetical protein SPPG_05459 [Spizellomyces punctatus DAOM BR117]